MPPPQLTALSREALEKLAKQRGIPGAAGLTKAQLLGALQSSAKRPGPRTKPAAGPAATRAQSKVKKKSVSPAPAASARRV
jgi:hypothetical protein